MSEVDVLHAEVARLRAESQRNAERVRALCSALEEALEIAGDWIYSEMSGTSRLEDELAPILRLRAVLDQHDPHNPLCPS